MNVPLSGVYVRRRGRHEHVVDATCACFYRPGEAYRTAHPYGCGDHGGYIRLDGRLAAEMGPWPDARPLGPSHTLRFRNLLRLDDPDAVFEEAVALVDDVLHGPPVPANPSPEVRRVMARLATRPGHRSTLDQLAADVGLTRFTLARAFRRATGRTVHRYREDNRLAHAVQRLDEDLTELALDLGFSSHSHFTARFRARLGLTPSAARI
jgi:AraC-like DNA-binding protein